MKTEVTEPDALLTPAEVAARLRVDILTLANWRARRQGPQFLKVGRRAVRYRRADVDAFLAAGTRGAGEAA